MRLHFSRARRPDSACRSREPDGLESEAGVGWERRSKSVMLREEWRREARVRPEGPAPMIAIFGDVDAMISGIWVEVEMR